jgi:copper(I)-binding protein
LKRLAASILLLLLPVLAGAQASPLIVQNAWMRATPGSDTAAAYLVLRNTGVEPIIVIGVKSPVASHVMIHETTTKNGMSQMRMHEKLVIAPGQSVMLSPGGMHVMLSGLKKSLLIGQTVPLVLLLANGGTVQTAVIVKPLDAQ